MKIDKELISRVAELSKIELSEEEKEKFCIDFKEVLSAFSVLDELELKNTKSSFRPIEDRNSLRKDTPRPSLKQNEALCFTENKEDGFFIGPKTIG